MGNDSLKQAIKEVEIRRQNAVFAANSRQQELSDKIPRIGELTASLSQTGLLLSKVIFSQGKNARPAIEKIMYDNQSNQRELSFLLVSNGYPPDYLDIHYTCKKCEDSGYINGVKCDCLKHLITKHNVYDFNLSKPSNNQTFESFLLEYYSDTPVNGGISNRATMSQILNNCKDYARLFNKHSKSILMFGDTGLGKTHLSLAIANEVMQKGFTALYASAPDLFRKLQNEYYGKSEYGVDTMELLSKADLVIIDDLGAEIENQFNISAVYNVVNMRINSNKPTIINTNFTFSEIEKRYNDRVASRITTIYRCIKFVGKDVRQIKLKTGELYRQK